MVEQIPLKDTVVGSNPTGRTRNKTLSCARSSTDRAAAFEAVGGGSIPSGRTMNKKPYQEHEGDSFKHDGTHYDINKIFNVVYKKEVSHASVMDLVWNLEHSKMIDNAGKLVCGSCYTMKGNKVEHAERVSKVNLSHPIIVLRVDNSKLLCIDGVHRIEKALKTGVENLPIKIISKEELNSCKM